MSNKKYRLTDDSRITDDNVEVFRIQALKDFGDVRAGDLGGFVGSEDDLASALGDRSWIYDDSVVYGSEEGKGAKANTFVKNNSQVKSSYLSDALIDNSVIENSDCITSKIVEGSHVENGSFVISSTISESHLDETDALKSFIYEQSDFKDSNINVSFARGVESNSSEINKSETHNSELLASTIRGSNITDSTTVASRVAMSKVEGSKLKSNGFNVLTDVLNDSYIRDSEVFGSKIDNSSVYFEVVAGRELKDETFGKNPGVIKLDRDDLKDLNDVEPIRLNDDDLKGLVVKDSLSL